MLRPHHAVPALSALAAALLVPQAALADEDEYFDDSAPIVVTGERDHGVDLSATKTPTPLLDTPQSVVALDRKRLDDQGLSSWAMPCAMFPA